MKRGRVMAFRSVLAGVVSASMVFTLSFAPALAVAGDGSRGLSAGGTSECGVPEWAVDDGRNAKALKTQEALPGAYDLREEGLVTPVKLQNPWGSCWAFGGTAAAETSILSSHGVSYADTVAAGEPLDLSERHLTYFALQPVSADVNPAQVGEGLHVIAQEDAENPDRNAAFDAGGLPIYITTLFSQGIGPMEESMFPYWGKDKITGQEYYDLHPEELTAETKRQVAALAEQLGFDSYEAYIQHTGRTEEEVLEMYKPAVYGLAACYWKGDDWSIPETSESGQSNRLLSNGEVLKNGNVLPAYWNGDAISQECRTAIKQELVNGRGVTIMYSAKQAGEYTKSDAGPGGGDFTQYVNEKQKPNHGVCIVGWDDGYAAENFSKDPGADGAWIVKNSWGSQTDEGPDANGKVVNGGTWGAKDADGKATGYFYLSYYDQTIQQPETMEFTSNLGTSGVFYAMQHDYMPANSGFYTTGATSGDDGVQSSANVFEADEALELKSISTRAAEANTRVTFAIYELRDGADGSDPTDGTMVYRFSRNFEYGGFHRVDLDRPITIAAGKRFSVVSTASTIDAATGKRSYNVSANRGLSKKATMELRAKSQQVKVYQEAVVNKGESFYYANGEWKDWSAYLAGLDVPVGDKDVQELFTILTPANYEHYTELLPVDNFSIKVYAEPAQSALTHVRAQGATCTDEGCIEHWYDAGSGAYYSDGAGAHEIGRQATVIAPLGHDWGKGAVTTEPTACTAGVRTFRCTRCGATKTEVIAPLVTAGKSYAVSGSVYKVTSNAPEKRTVVLTRAKNVKNFTVEASVTIQGAEYQVVGIGAGAFAKAKAARSVTVKTKLLTASSVKGCLKGSKVTKVAVKVGAKAQNKKYVKKYKALFAGKKPVAGKSVKVA